MIENIMFILDQIVIDKATVFPLFFSLAILSVTGAFVAGKESERGLPLEELEENMVYCTVKQEPNFVFLCKKTENLGETERLPRLYSIKGVDLKNLPDYDFFLVQKTKAGTYHIFSQRHQLEEGNENYDR